MSRGRSLLDSRVVSRDLLVLWCLRLLVRELGLCLESDAFFGEVATYRRLCWVNNWGLRLFPAAAGGSGSGSTVRPNPSSTNPGNFRISKNWVKESDDECSSDADGRRVPPADYLAPVERVVRRCPAASPGAARYNRGYANPTQHHGTPGHWWKRWTTN